MEKRGGFPSALKYFITL